MFLGNGGQERRDGTGESLPVLLKGFQFLTATVRELVVPAWPIGVVDFPIARDETGIVQSVQERVNRSLDLSYGVYLWGYPIQQLVIQVNPDLPVAFSVALTIVFTLAVATLSWRHLAAPALGLKHSARTEPIRGLDGNQPFLRLRSHPCRDVEPTRHACEVSLVWQCQDEGLVPRLAARGLRLRSTN